MTSYKIKPIILKKKKKLFCLICIKIMKIKIFFVILFNYIVILIIQGK